MSQIMPLGPTAMNPMGVYPGEGVTIPILNDWWGVAGATCLAAYQPIGAASQAAAKVNLANPGTYDLVVALTEPSWDSINGFTGNSTGYFNTGIPSSSVKTSILRLDTISRGGTYCPYGQANAGSNQRNHLTFLSSTNTYAYGNYVPVADTSTSGIYCISSQNGYKNGVDVCDIPSGDSQPSAQLFLMALNSVSPFGFVGTLQAAAFYSDELSAAEVAALTTRMAAL